MTPAPRISKATRAAVADVLRAHPGGAIHLMGMGGVGMAGLATLLHARGYRVSGCDVADNRLIKRLRAAGLPVHIGHDSAHVPSDVALLIRSTAVPSDHPEALAARQRGAQVWRRGEVLPVLLEGERSIAISGTHGKTTTTAMTAHLFRAMGHAPTFFVGGEWEEDGRVAETGAGDCFIVEADESDGTLAGYHPHIGVLTGIDYDHMEHFDDESAFLDVFRAFLQQITGFALYCRDDERLTEMARETVSVPSLSYGFHAEADLRAVDVVETALGSTFTVVRKGSVVGTAVLPVTGRHNIQNALAALLAYSCHHTLNADVLCRMHDFKSVRRRFQRIGVVRGAQVISDYAHHPAEIRALIQAARQLPHERILAVFQPHRYTRTLALGSQFPEAFAGVDHVVLAPVYAASEAPLSGGRSEDLAAHFRGHAVQLECVDSIQTAWDRLRRLLRAGDVALIIGAGDVEQVALWAQQEMTEQ